MRFTQFFFRLTGVSPRISPDELMRASDESRNNVVFVEMWLEMPNTHQSTMTGISLFFFNKYFCTNAVERNRLKLPLTLTPSEHTINAIVQSVALMASTLLSHRRSKTNGKHFDKLFLIESSRFIEEHKKLLKSQDGNLSLNKLRTNRQLRHSRIN